jgi:hypothetical protein
MLFATNVDRRDTFGPTVPMSKGMEEAAAMEDAEVMDEEEVMEEDEVIKEAEVMEPIPETGTKAMDGRRISMDLEEEEEYRRRTTCCSNS